MHADIIKLNVNSVMWGFYNAWAHTGFVCGMPWMACAPCRTQSSIINWCYC